LSYGRNCFPWSKLTISLDRFVPFLSITRSTLH